MMTASPFTALVLFMTTYCVDSFFSSSIYDLGGMHATGIKAGPMRGNVGYYETMFEQYVVAYEKEYATYEVSHPYRQARFKAFSSNLDLIVFHNQRYDQGLVSFTLGLNALADLTNQEYRQTLLGYHVSSPRSLKMTASETFTRFSYEDALPDTFDWRDHQAVTPVKNQGMCGSCWAFSAVASMECVYAQKTGTLVSFSEQELVDCVLGGVDSCNHGGEMQDGFDEIIRHHGGKIDPEDVYRYTAQSKGTCLAQDEQAVGHFTSFGNVTSGDEDAVKAAVATRAVLSIAIDASSPFFQLYRHGVFNWPFCKNKPTELDHGVALVGYGTEGQKDYWLVKNSWGPTWGLNGYIKMSRNKGNQCGVATDASYPIMT